MLISCCLDSQKAQKTGNELFSVLVDVARAVDSDVMVKNIQQKFSQYVKNDPTGGVYRHVHFTSQYYPITLHKTHLSLSLLGFSFSFSPLFSSKSWIAEISRRSRWRKEQSCTGAQSMQPKHTSTCSIATAT